MVAPEVKAETFELTPFEHSVLRAHVDRGIVMFGPLVAKAVEGAGGLRGELCAVLESLLAFSGHLGFDIRTAPLVLEDGGAELCAMLATQALRSRAELDPGEVDVWLAIAARMSPALREIAREVDQSFDDLEVK